MALLGSPLVLADTAEDVNKDLYGYIGFGIGKFDLSTDVAADKGDKDGPAKNFTVSLTYYRTWWGVSLNAGYYDMYLENDKTGVDYVKLISENFYIGFAPEFRMTHRLSVGLNYQHMLGEEILAGPSSIINADNEKTTKSVAGVFAWYDIPFNSFRMRAGLSFGKPLSIGNRSASIMMVRFQFGVPIIDREPDKVKIVYRDREVVKTVPAEIIELGEQVINFRSGSYRLNPKSADLIRRIGNLLATNLEDWEIVRVVGHTDIVGSAESNQILSENRANSVKNILINENGLDRTRVFYLGFGEERLKTEGTTPEDHSTNRRVELQFIGHIDKEFADKVKELVREETQQ